MGVLQTIYIQIFHVFSEHLSTYFFADKRLFEWVTFVCNDSLGIHIKYTAFSLDEKYFSFFFVFLCILSILTFSGKQVRHPVVFSIINGKYIILWPNTIFIIFFGTYGALAIPYEE